MKPLSAILLLAGICCGCSDSPGKTPGDTGSSPDTGSPGDTGVGSNATTNNNVDAGFTVWKIRDTGVERGERLVTSVALEDRGPLDCSRGLPTFTLRPANGAPQTVTALDCAEYGFRLDFVADVEPGVYQPEVADGSGALGDTQGLEVEVFDKRGLDQAPVGAGRSPDLAATPEIPTTVIGAVDPASGTLFLLPRGADFGPSNAARIDTDVAANLIRLSGMPERASSVAFVAAWASDTEVGLLWLDEQAQVIGQTAPLPANAPVELDLVGGGNEWAVAWREPDGTLRVAGTIQGVDSWTLEATEIGRGEWPSLTHDALSFRLYWSTGAAETSYRGFRTSTGPAPDTQIMEFGWAHCDFAHTSGHRVCSAFNQATGEHAFTSAMLGSKHFELHFATPPAGPPPRAEREPTERLGRDPIFVGYRDAFGGTTYELIEDRNGNYADDPRRIIGRYAQRSTASNRPQLAAHATRDDFVMGWVIELDGQIELGTMLFASPQ